MILTEKDNHKYYKTIEGHIVQLYVKPGLFNLMYTIRDVMTKDRITLEENGKPYYTYSHYGYRLKYEIDPKDFPEYFI